MAKRKQALSLEEQVQKLKKENRFLKKENKDLKIIAKSNADEVDAFQGYLEKYESIAREFSVKMRLLFSKGLEEIETFEKIGFRHF